MDTPSIVRDLGRPEAYGCTGVPVTVRTTHASWVFLVGADAWKVKRPVELGFLDFRTPEARRRACEEELRLNRRLAPEVYLAVEPVRATGSGHAVVGDGPIVDWAVHMRRLPDEASCAALLAAGRLDAPALEEVATRLAGFLSTAPLAPMFGAPEVLARNVDENFSQVAPLVGDLVDARTYDEVRAFQLGTLAAARDRFAARVTSGRIRDGHGDLRLEHVYLLPGRAPLVIDCIDFNERFRCGDVASEAAFFAMELEAAGWPELAAGFIARFVEATDDFELYGVLDFYLSYRAWVRGKVAAFVAADRAASTEVVRAKRAEALRDFSLARACTGRPREAPRLIAVNGLIGSGKSVLAAALGRALGAPVVSSDRTRKAMASIAPTERADVELYGREQRERVYSEILRRASEALAAGRDAIVDATFATRRWRALAVETARRAQARLLFLETEAPLEVLRARLAMRREHPGTSISDATDSLLVAALREREPIAAAEGAPHISVDTAGSGDDVLAAALRGIAARARAL